QPADHRYVRLAAALSGASLHGAVRLTFSAPGSWGVVRDWAEQLFEESLGKGGQGVMVFAEEGRTPSLPGPLVHGARERIGEVWLRITGDARVADSPGVFTLREPLIASADGA